jgi:hypothetical protein
MVRPRSWLIPQTEKQRDRPARTILQESARLPHTSPPIKPRFGSPRSLVFVDRQHDRGSKPPFNLGAYAMGYLIRRSHVKHTRRRSLEVPGDSACHEGKRVSRHWCCLILLSWQKALRLGITYRDKHSLIFLLGR